MLSLQPQVSSGAHGERPEDKVLDLAADVLKKLPDLIDYDQTAKILADDPSPLNVVLLQEVFLKDVAYILYKIKLIVLFSFSSFSLKQSSNNFYL